MLKPISISLPSKGRDIRINRQTGKIRIALTVDEARNLNRMIFEALVAEKRRKEIHGI